MNEEALNDAHKLFVETGYNGDVKSFKELISTNKDALKDAYSLFVKTGYNGDESSFSELVGLKKKEKAGSTVSPLGSAQQTGDSDTQSQTKDITGSVSQLQEPRIKPEDRTTTDQELFYELRADLDKPIDTDMVALYDSYKKEGELSPIDKKKIEETIDDQKKGKRSLWEDVGAYAQGMMMTGYGIPIYKWDKEENLISIRKEAKKRNFLEALPQEKRIELNEYANNRTRKLDLETTNLLAENEGIKEKRRLGLKNLLHMKDALEKMREEGTPFPEAAMEDYKNLYDQVDSLTFSYNSNVDAIESNKKDIGSFVEELDLFKKNYGGLEYYKDWARLAFAKQMGGVMEFVSTTREVLSEPLYMLSGLPPLKKDKKSKEVREEFIKDFREEIINQQDYLKPLMSVSEIESPSDAVKWMAEQVATQLSTTVTLVVSGGAVGLPLLGAASGGQKMGEMRDEGIYSLPEIYLAGVGYGFTEMLTEIPTLNIISKGSRILKTLSKKEIKDGAEQWGLKAIPLNALKEGGAEGINQGMQNFIDIVGLGDENTHILDNMVDAIASGKFMGAAMTTVPMIVGMGSRTFMTKDLSTKLSENSRNIEKFTQELELKKETIGESTKKILNKKVKALLKDQEKILKGTYDKAKNMDKGDIATLINLDKKANSVARAANEIINSDLPDSVKNDLLEDLKRDADKVSEKKNAILDKKPIKKDGTEQVQKQPDETSAETSVNPEEAGADRGAKGREEIKGEGGTESSVVGDGEGVQQSSVGNKGDTQPVRDAKKWSWDNLSKQPLDKLEARLEDVKTDLGGALPEEVDGLKSKISALESQIEMAKEETIDDDISKIDISEKTGLNKVSKILDKWDKDLEQFGKETLGSNIPVAVARGAVQAMKAVVGTAKTSADIISAGINYLKTTDWYKGLDKSEKTKVEKKFINSISKPKERTITDRDIIEEKLNDLIGKKGMSEKDAIEEMGTPKEKMIAKDILSRKKIVSGKQALKNTRDSHRSSMEKIYERPSFIERAKKLLSELARTTVDRQFLPKHLFKKNFGKTMRNYVIAAKGASGYAKYSYDHYRKDIYGFLREVDIENLNIILFNRRLLAIDSNRKERGLPPVVHSHFENSQTSQAALDELKKELGDKKFNDLNRRADLYFEAFRDILQSYKESGMITQEALDLFFTVDYQPRLYLQYIKKADEDMSISEMGAPETSSLSSGVIKSMEEGSDADLIRDSEYLLSRSLNIASRVNAANTLANRLSLYLEEMETKIEEIKSKPKKSSKDNTAIKNYEELKKHVFQNRIVGFSESGKPKYAHKPNNHQKVYNYKTEGTSRQMIMSDRFHSQLTDSQNAFITNNVLRERIARYSWTGIIKAIATGINPSFFMTNTPRDFVFVLAFSGEYSNNLLKGVTQLTADMAKGVKDIETNDPTFQNFVEHGGMMDFLHTQGKFKKVKGISGILNRKGLIGNRTNQVAHVAYNLTTFKEMQMLSEMGIRVGVFSRSIKNQLSEYKVKNEESLREKLKNEGYSDSEVDWKVKDIYINAVASARGTTDFNQGGTYIKDFDALVPYLNAGTQGVRSAVLALEERPLETSLRMVQGGIILGAVPIALGLKAFLTEDDDDNWTEEVKEMSVFERYKYAREGLSMYELINYQPFFTGKMVKGKSGEMEFEYYRVAKPQALTPVTVYVENLLLNQIYKNEGIGEISREDNIKAIKFAIENNISPIDFSISGNITKNPVIKSSLTYITGYDFYRNQDLSHIKGDVLPAVEGHESKSIENFYKVWGEKYGLSPARTKAAVESLITSPSVSPYVSATYGILENSVSNEEYSFTKELGKISLQSFTNRIYKTTSEFNRYIDWDKEFEKEIVNWQIKEIKNKTLFKDLAKGLKKGEVGNEEINTEFRKMAGEDVFEFQRLVNTFKETLKKPDQSPVVTDLKFRKPYQRALILARLFGDNLFEERKIIGKENQKLYREVFSNDILNNETIVKYKEIISKKRGGK